MWDLENKVIGSTLVSIVAAASCTGLRRPLSLLAVAPAVLHLLLFDVEHHCLSSSIPRCMGSESQADGSPSCLRVWKTCLAMLSMASLFVDVFVPNLFD